MRQDPFGRSTPSILLPVAQLEPRRGRIDRCALKRTSIRSLRVAETTGESLYRIRVIAIDDDQ
jgi:hypothetical protein